MMISTLLSRLKTFNIFTSPGTRNNEYELQNERISTRIFILALIICTLIIFIYTAQMNITHTVEVKNPSYDNFQSLSILYPHTLRCPCNNVAISYESFIHLEIQLHQLCYSIFITKDWINHIGSSAIPHISDDFSYVSALIFLSLASFCHRANDTIINAIQTFNSSQFITVDALNENIFINQIDVIIQTIQQSTELKYYQAFKLIQFSIQSNVLLTGLLSNTVLQYDSTDKVLIPTPRLYANNTCNCDLTYSCTDPLTLEDHRNNQSNSLSLFTIPGLFKGCYLGEAVRQSTLECFYDISCIAMIELLLQPPLLLNNSIIPLDSSIDSRFNISSTMDQLLSKGMTEKWKKNISHEQYFIQCQVILCTYSYISKFNIMYIITTLIGLIGGLTKIFRLFIPHIVKFIRRRLIPNPTTINDLNVNRRSLIERIRTYNYFSKPYPISTETEIKQQIISTRFFILLLIISIIVLISYYGIEKVNILHKVESPTFDEYIKLQSDQHANPTFSCPCSTLTIAYEKFIQLEYILHPFCSSDFVQKNWLYSLGSLNTYDVNDFAARAPPIFSTLAALCESSANHINNGLISFNASLFISDEVLTPMAFLAETNAIINTFISSITRSFTRNLALSSNITKSNALMSTRMTNFAFLVEYKYPTYSVTYTGLGYYVPSGNTTVICWCRINLVCLYPLSFYIYHNETNFSTNLLIPGLFSSCLLNEGIYASTLICFFDQSCVDMISSFGNILSANAIDINNLFHFSVNSKIDDILNQLFVDQWKNSTSHRSFYEECHSTRCTYTLVQNNSFWFILTTIFGLIGGLIKILQVIIPYLVQGVYALYFRYIRRNHTETNNSTNSSTFSFRFIINRLQKLNLFSSDNSDVDDEHEIQGQIISTRIFLILLVLSVIVLTIYSSQTQITKTVTIMNPSIEQYQSLYNRYSSTLTCPCKNIAVEQETFLTLQPIFHQVCQSDFVNNQWIYSFDSITLPVVLYTRDFRSLGASTLNTLRSLCQLSFTTIHDGLLDFGKSSFITTNIIAKDRLLKQGKSLLDFFISSNENAFITSFQTIRDIIQTNVLLSGDATSTSIRVSNITAMGVQMETRAKVYPAGTNYSCYDDVTYIEQAYLYIYPGKIIYYTIPGFYIGCYMVEATLKSNLAAFYNQSWLDDFMKNAFSNFTSNIIHARALNASLDSQYNITTPINILMENLMIESWNPYVNYSAYYEQCHPIECKYTYVVKYDIIYIITTIIGLIGGLVTIYQLVIPRMIKIIRQCWFKWHRHTTIQVIPTVAVSHTN